MTRPMLPPVRLGSRLGFQEDRRQHVNSVNDQLIKPTRVSGFYEIAFQGTATTQEIAVDVEFPVWFVDRPGMSFSAELMRDILEPGNFPTISVVVVSWVKEHDVRPGGGLFTGCRLAIVASGRAGEEMIVHWQADAKAMNVVNVGVL